MEYQKILNLLHDITNQSSKFRTRNQVETSYESKVKYKNSKIRFKTSTIRSNLRYYRDAVILAKGTITVSNTAAAGVAVNDINKKVIFKNCAPFTNSII